MTVAPELAPLARRIWRRLEPYHAITYFAAESRAALDAVGMKGFWMGYFASRSAAMGPAAICTRSSVAMSSLLTCR